MNAVAPQMLTPSGLPPVIRWDGQQLVILNQCLLPAQIVEETLDCADSVHRAIAELRVRGAPAIGIAAAYGLVLGLAAYQHAPTAEFLARARELASYLDSARPTAVNLHRAVMRVCQAMQVAATDTTPSARLWQIGCREAAIIEQMDRDLCTRIGEYGRPWIHAGQRILTHCNAGALATAGSGTALAPLYLAHAQGVSFEVYATETRPLLQGARLTILELDRAGIDVTLICDHAAASLMAQGRVDLVIVGTDRVAANGDVVNKIGTLSLAVCAHHFDIPFVVACPSTTFDSNLARGTDTIIENRAPAEITHIAGHAIAAPGVSACNPAFDITPAALVTAFITDQGEIRPPIDGRFASWMTACHDHPKTANHAHLDLAGRRSATPGIVFRKHGSGTLESFESGLGSRRRTSGNRSPAGRSGPPRQFADADTYPGYIRTLALAKTSRTQRMVAGNPCHHARL